MGVDIHEHLVLQRFDGTTYFTDDLHFPLKGTPQTFAPFFEGRNSLLFCILAGTDEMSLLSNRGIPTGAAIDQSDGGCYFTPTWWEIGEFETELERTIVKIEKFIVLEVLRDPEESLENYTIEYECLVRQLKDIKQKVNGYRKQIVELKEFDVEKTKVFIYFDH